MFSIDDYWKIFKTIKGETIDLDSSIKATAQTDKSKSIQLFENTLDQVCFSSNDYNKFRNFLIDWYASLRTLTSIQTKATDPFSISNTHLDELFKSFGFPYSGALNISDNSLDVNKNKANFYLDLINLYKIKGTPESIVKTLAYYGLNVDLSEFWLKKNPFGDLFFEGKKVYGNASQSSGSVINFNLLTQNDPHWFISESKIHSLISQRRLSLPSKSPYFSLRIDFSVDNIKALLSVIAKELQVMYDDWQLTSTIPNRDIDITFLSNDQQISLLELYLSIIILFNKTLNNPLGSISGSDLLVYNDTTSEISIDVINEYMDLINLQRPVDITRVNNNEVITYNILESAQQDYFDKFTRLASERFLLNSSSADNLLNQLNPNLKNEIDNFDFENIEYNLKLFVQTLDSWIKNKLESFLQPNFTYYLFGEKYVIKDIKNIVNFFKPFRSRLTKLENSHIFDNRLFNTMLIYDEVPDYLLYESVHQYYGDPVVLSCNTYDCGSYYDWENMYISITDSYEIFDSNTYNDKFWCGATLPETDIIKNTAVFSGPDLVSASQVTGFADFDIGGTFDCTGGADSVFISVQNI